MRTLVFCLLAPVLLQGCTSAASPTSTRTAAGGVHCISLQQVAGRRASGRNAVLFEMVGPTNYLNNLRGGCPSLARLGSTATISIATGGEGGQLCTGDQIRVFDPIELERPRIVGAPICVLGDFVPVSRAR